MGEGFQNPGANRSIADDATFCSTEKTGCVAGSGVTASGDLSVERLSGRPKRIRTPGKGKARRPDTVHLVAIAMQELEKVRNALAAIDRDAPEHERKRRLIPVLSDAGLAMRSVEEAIERWKRGSCECGI